MHESADPRRAHRNRDKPGTKAERRRALSFMFGRPVSKREYQKWTRKVAK